MATSDTSVVSTSSRDAAITCTAAGMQKQPEMWYEILQQNDIPFNSVQHTEVDRLVTAKLVDVSLGLKTSELDEMKRRVFWTKFGNDGKIVPTDATDISIVNTGAVQMSMKELFAMIADMPENAYHETKHLIPQRLREPNFVNRVVLSLLSAEDLNFLHALYCVGQ